MTHSKTRALIGSAGAFVLSGVLWGTVLALFGFYPFGEKSILITDMSSQYVEYFAAFTRMVREGDSLLFTWDTGMGMNFLGIWAYYLASPFTPVLLLFPQELLTEGILVLISLKIAASGAAMSLYLHGRFRVDGIWNLVFSAAYALSAYSVVYCFNLMWLDGVLLLPLVLLAARRVFDSPAGRPAPGRCLLLAAVLAVLFIANFYIAYIVGVFAFLVYLMWCFTAWEGGRRTAIRLGTFVGTALLAACASAVVLLPAFFSLQNGYETVHGLSLTFGAAMNPLAIPGKLAYGAFDSATHTGTANLYCGVLTAGLLPLWFCSRSIPRREKIGVGCLLFLMTLSLFLYDLDVAWHVFQPPTWFPARYSFTVVFLLVTCAARTLSKPQGLRPAAILISSGCMAAVTALLSGIPSQPFAGVAWITLLLIGIYALLGCAFVCFGREGARPALRRIVRPVAAGLMALLLCAELTGSSLRMLKGLDGQFGFEDRDAYTAFRERGASLMAALDTVAEDDGFYRVENATARNSNDGLSIGYPAVSHYSSLSNQRTFRLLGALGMTNYVSHRYLRYYGATSALDALLGVRYVFDTEERRPGLTDTGAVVGDTRIYRNENALPLVYFADAAVLPKLPENGTPFSLQNELLGRLEGTETAYYSALKVDAAFSGNMTETNGRIRLDGSGLLTFAIENPKEQDVLLYVQNNLPENTDVYLNGRRLNVYDDRLVTGVIELGRQPAGRVEVKFSVWGKDKWIAAPAAAGFDEAAFADLAVRLKLGGAEDLTVTDTTVSGRLTAPEDGVLFTTIPADSGWTAELDGKPVETETALGAFLALPVSKGAHTFRLAYCPRGLKTGAVLSAAGLLLTGIWMGLDAWQRRKNKRNPGTGGGLTEGKDSEIGQE